MKKNINNVERVLRFSGGALLSSMAFWGPKQKWMLSFLVPTVTGIVGTCPLYSAMGISTLSEKKNVEEQANDYFPVQSDSERVAGHPFVGSV